MPYTVYRRFRIDKHACLPGPQRSCGGKERKKERGEKESAAKWFPSVSSLSPPRLRGGHSHETAFGRSFLSRTCTCTNALAFTNPDSRCPSHGHHHARSASPSCPTRRPCQACTTQLGTVGSPKQGMANTSSTGSYVLILRRKSTLARKGVKEHVENHACKVACRLF